MAVANISFTEVRYARKYRMDMLPSFERGVSKIETPGGIQETKTVNELCIKYRKGVGLFHSYPR